MSKPKPTTATHTQQTATGKPRQRAPGAGAPTKGRRHHLSRVDAATLAHYQTLATAWHCTLADALARAAAQAITQLPKNSPPQ